MWCWQFTVVVARTHISFVGRSVRWRTLIWWIWLAPWVTGIVVFLIDVESSLSPQPVPQGFRSGFSRGVRCFQTGSSWDDWRYSALLYPRLMSRSNRLVRRCWYCEKGWARSVVWQFWDWCTLGVARCLRPRRRSGGPYVALWGPYVRPLWCACPAPS